MIGWLQQQFAQFHSPWALLFLPLPFLLAWRAIRSRKGRALRYSSTALFGEVKPSIWIKLSRLLPWLRAIALSLLIIALARPREGLESQEVLSEGIDIVLLLDISGSMQALDLIPPSTIKRFSGMSAERFVKQEWPKYSRLGVAKEVVDEFIQHRSGDRLGLVGFSGAAQVLCPLTLDHGILRDLLAQTDFETIPVNGTAIGDAMMNAMKRLEHSKAPSKVILLLTDGAQNAGRAHPSQAAAIAQALGIRIHTIGVGKQQGTQLQPVQNPFTGTLSWNEVPIHPSDRVDEASLREIAQMTGGKFFMATDRQQLKKIYDDIDSMEKSKIRTRTFTKYREQFAPWLIAGTILLLVELLLSRTRLMRVP